MKIKRKQQITSAHADTFNKYAEATQLQRLNIF